MKPPSTHNASSGLSLLESVIALTVTLIVFGVVLLAIRSSGSMVSAGQALTSAQAEAEACCALVRDQIRSSGLASGGRLTLSTSALQGPLVNDTVTYSQLVGYDEAHPLDVTWGEERQIRFEADGTELPANGVDDDGDGLIDEGQVSLYRVASGDRISTLATNVSAFRMSLDTGPASGGLPRVTVSVTVKRSIDAAGDASAKAFSPYTSTRVIALLN